MEADISDFPKRILHADDDEMIREVVESLLCDYSDLHYEVCSDGQELVEKAQSFKPDLILLDLKMPVMSGPDVMALLAQEKEKITAPIIIFTGYMDVKMCDAYAKLGVIGVLHKPMNVGFLPERIRYMWAQSQGKEGIPGGGSSGLM